MVALPMIAAGLATCLAEYGSIAVLTRRSPGPPALAAARLAVRGRRRYGAFLAHAGILVVAAGLAGSHFWQQERQVTLRAGQTVSVGGHTLELVGTREREAGDHSEQVAQLRLGSETLEPARLSYAGLGGQSVTRVAIRSSALDDVYVVLAAPPADGAASLAVFVNPLVTWIWAGAALLICGMLLGNLGRVHPEPAPAPAPARVPAPSPAP